MLQKQNKINRKPLNKSNGKKKHFYLAVLLKKKALKNSNRPRREGTQRACAPHTDRQKKAILLLELL